MCVCVCVWIGGWSVSSHDSRSTVEITVDDYFLFGYE